MRLIDADALRDALYDADAITMRGVAIINRSPTIDAVPVVRCKECRYHSQYSDENGMYHCGGIDTTKDHALPVVAPDDFCSYGERRSDD